MTRLVLRVLALIVAGWTTSAASADLNYAPRGPYTVNQPLNAYSWAGPYLGGNLGYAWGSVDNSLTKPNGIFGGVQGGYNWQNGPFVFGVEADIQASSANDTFAPRIRCWTARRFSQTRSRFASSAQMQMPWCVRWNGSGPVSAAVALA